MAEPAANPANKFSIGTVLKKTFTAFFRGLGHFMLLGAVCYLPVLFTTYFQTASVLNADTPEAMTEALAFDPLMMAFNLLLPMICASVFAAIAIYEVVLDDAGVRPTLAQAISASMPRMVPVMLASIVFTVIVYTGLILLIIPGLFLVTMFWVTVPCVVMERMGPMAALKRSAELTKGYRWSVFGLILVFIIIVSLMQMAISVPLLLIGSVVKNALIITALNFLSYTIFGVLSALAVAYSYIQLKISKEGSSVQELADVFS